MAVLTSGNPAVDLMGSIRITGNITDLEWYKHIRKPSGKPNHLAVSILSDIVYWYRPTDVRDENTGFVIAKKKKFKSAAGSVASSAAGTIGRELGKSIGGKVGGKYGKTLGGNVFAQLGRSIMGTFFK